MFIWSLLHVVTSLIPCNLHISLLIVQHSPIKVANVLTLNTSHSHSHRKLHCGHYKNNHFISFSDKYYKGAISRHLILCYSRDHNKASQS
jgi:hypothetical protein